MQLSRLQNNITLLFPFHFLACNLFALERETCACIFAVSGDLFKSNDRARVDAARIERVSGVTLGSEKSRCGRSGTIAFYRAGSPIFSLFLSLSFFRSVYTPTLRVSAVFPPCVPPISVAVVRDEFATRITEISASTGGYRSSRSFSLPSFYYPNPRSLSSRIPPFISAACTCLYLLCTRYVFQRSLPARSFSSTETPGFVLPSQGTNHEVVAPLASISLSVTLVPQAALRSTFVESMLRN